MAHTESFTCSDCSDLQDWICDAHEMRAICNAFCAYRARASSVLLTGPCSPFQAPSALRCCAAGEFQALAGSFPIRP